MAFHLGRFTAPSALLKRALGSCCSAADWPCRMKATAESWVERLRLTKPLSAARPETCTRLGRIGHSAERVADQSARPAFRDSSNATARSAQKSSRTPNEIGRASCRERV